MADMIDSLQSETGLESGQVEGGLGAIFEFLKKQLPPELFSALESALPQASGLINTNNLRPSGEPGAEADSGLLGSLVGLATKALGGKAADLGGLLEMLGKAGFSMEQAMAFVPKAIAMLQNLIPPELFQKILASLPALAGMVMKSNTPAEQPE